MCDLNREFELQIWRDSIEFGKINKGTLSFSNVSENNKEIKIKGEINLPAGTLPGGIFSLHGAGESCTIKAKERQKEKNYHERNSYYFIPESQDRSG